MVYDFVKNHEEKMGHKNYVAVVDCGSQTTKLIARRIRELGVFSKIFLPSTILDQINKELPLAIIISGGPDSLTQENSVRVPKELYCLGIPILGICYGMQSIVDHFNGKLFKAPHKEFGFTQMQINNQSLLFKDIAPTTTVWMSHSDQAQECPLGFTTIANSETCKHAAIENAAQKIYGVQFHPEVSHTEKGKDILSNFLFTIANAQVRFDLTDFLQNKIDEIKKVVGNEKVIMGLSGGVDSMVAALIIDKAIGENLCPVYVNHGLYRHGEIENVQKSFKDAFGRDLLVLNAQEEFLSSLEGVSDPEQKRKIIGKIFVDVFERQAKISNANFLGQGTLYPDVIESPHSSNGHAQGIKSHHNVGGLPEKMNLKLIEPLRELFKDEVRKIGYLMGISGDILEKEPFPGPGLAVRCVGDITEEKLKIVRKADKIVMEEIKKALHEKKYLAKIWQAFAIILPVKSVGVTGDARAYGYTIVIRAVQSEDAMTADWVKLPYDVLGSISTRITNEVEGVNRVLYDITQKPPATIEWE